MGVDPGRATTRAHHPASSPRSPLLYDGAGGFVSVFEMYYPVGEQSSLRTTTSKYELMMRSTCGWAWGAGRGGSGVHGGVGLFYTWRGSACCARWPGYGFWGSGCVQVVDGSPDAFDHVCKSIVMCRPATGRFGMRRKYLESGEGGILPIGGTQENGDEAGLLCLVARYCLVH